MVAGPWREGAEQGGARLRKNPRLVRERRSRACGIAITSIAATPTWRHKAAATPFSATRLVHIGAEETPLIMCPFKSRFQIISALQSSPSCPPADGQPETMKCHSDPAVAGEESCSALGGPRNKNQGEISLPRLRDRNDSQFQSNRERARGRGEQIPLVAPVLYGMATVRHDLSTLDSRLLDSQLSTLGS